MSEETSSPVYEISTLADIIEKIPAHRIPTFMEEATGLLTGIASARGTFALMSGVDNPVTLSLPLKWTDDGDDEVRLGFNGPEASTSKEARP